MLVRVQRNSLMYIAGGKVKWHRQYGNSLAVSLKIKHILTI